MTLDDDADPVRTSQPVCDGPVLECMLFSMLLLVHSGFKQVCTNCLLGCVVLREHEYMHVVSIRLLLFIDN